VSPISNQSAKWGTLIALASGLGASSCCVIQLVMNVLGFGCAGFAVLAPYRPVLLASAAIALLLPVILPFLFSPFNNSCSRPDWICGFKTLLSRKFLIQLLMVLGLAFSPEILQKVDQRLYDSVFSADSNNEQTVGIIHLQLSGVYCEGCRHRVKAALASLPGFIGCQVFLDDESLPSEVYVEIGNEALRGDSFGPSDETFEQLGRDYNFNVQVLRRTKQIKKAVS
jgi:copper chaperone CopZ